MGESSAQNLGTPDFEGGNQEKKGLIPPPPPPQKMPYRCFLTAGLISQYLGRTNNV